MVEDAVTEADALIMAAAVADFRPESVTEKKVKKTDDEDDWSLRLVKNPDILASVNREGLLKIGFAAETHDLLANAQSKLERKGLEMIIANDAVATIGAQDSTATIITRGQPEPDEMPGMSKSALASEILDRIVALFEARGDTEW